MNSVRETVKVRILVSVHKTASVRKKVSVRNMNSVRKVNCVHEAVSVRKLAQVYSARKYMRMYRDVFGLMPKDSAKYCTEWAIRERKQRFLKYKNMSIQQLMDDLHNESECGITCDVSDLCL